MAFWNKSEISKIKKKYGEEKGSIFLTYFYTFMTKTVLLAEFSDEEDTDEAAANIVSNLLARHGKACFDEFSTFVKANFQNANLLVELAKSGSVYLDDSLTAFEPTKTGSSEPTPEAPALKAAPAKGGLGRDESKHIFCKYTGHEDDCPDDCSVCAIAMKTDGDLAILDGKMNQAIRQYKKAVSASPMFAEAWANLGNAYSMRSEYDNALAAFNKAIAIDPKYGIALFGKAVALRNLGRPDEAMGVANTILAMYDDPSVKDFKQKLISAGVKDRSQILSAKEANVALREKAGKIMQDNDLANDDGTEGIIPEIYRPEEFTKAVLSYCKQKYASFGERKVRSECIITSFYGSMCAVLLYRRDPDGIRSGNIFDYLSGHLDVEFTDENAERLLGTKAGEEKAETIWSICLPYVTLAQEIFDAVDELTDEIMLDAMEYAYVLGMLTAKYYTSKKHK